MDNNARFDDQVMRCLHEVARAAREVPAELQPTRLQEALVSLVALDVFSTGTFTVTGLFDADYTPSAGPSS
jgi:hypothetical protein